jgi:hypothetical protein
MSGFPIWPRDGRGDRVWDGPWLIGSHGPQRRGVTCQTPRLNRWGSRPVRVDPAETVRGHRFPTVGESPAWRDLPFLPTRRRRGAGWPSEQAALGGEEVRDGTFAAG